MGNVSIFWTLMRAIQLAGGIVGGDWISLLIFCYLLQQRSVQLSFGVVQVLRYYAIVCLFSPGNCRTVEADG